MGARRLRNACLGYLSKLQDEETTELCLQQFRTAASMTDSVAAMRRTCIQWGVDAVLVQERSNSRKTITRAVRADRFTPRASLASSVSGPANQGSRVCVAVALLPM